MTIAECVYNALPEKERKQIYDIMDFSCPSNHGYKDDCTPEEVDFDNCFKCWMKEVEE